MAQEKVTFEGDASDLIAEYARLVNAQLKADQSLKELVVTSTKWDKEGNLSRAMIKALTNDNQQLAISLRQAEEGARAHAAGMRVETVSMRQAASAAKEAAQAERELAAARQRESDKHFRQQGDNFLRGTRRNLDTSNASDRELLNLRNAEAAVKHFQIQNQISAKQTEDIWRKVSQGVFTAYTTKLNGLQNQLYRLKQAHTALGEEARKAAAKAEAAQNRATRATQRQTAATQQAKQASHSLLLSWESVIRLATVSVVHRAISALTQELNESVEAAIDLQIALAEIRTIGGSRGSNLDTNVRNVSDAFAIPILEQAEAAYEALSNQVAHTNTELFSFIKTANEFAITTQATADDAVNLLTAAINSFGLETSQADEIAANFFKTIELGRVRAEELANIYGRVAVPANILGVTFEETNAALALMTINGVKANEAITFMRNIMLKLIRPTESMKDFFHEIGVESGEAGIRVLGFTGFMQRLEERTQGSANEIGELFGRIRAITGAMIFANENLDKYVQILEESTNATKQYNDALELVLNNTGKKLRIEMNEVKNFFIQDLVAPFLDGIVKISDETVEIDDAVKAIVKTISYSLTPALALAAIRAKTLALSLLAAHPAGAAIAAGVVAYGVLRTVIDANVTSTEDLIAANYELAKSQILSTQDQIAAIEGITASIERELLKRERLYTRALTEEKAEFNSAVAAETELFEEMSEKLEEIFSTISDNIKTELDNVESELERVVKNIDSNLKAIANIDIELSDKVFDINLEGLDAEQQISQISERIASLQRLASDEAAAGNSDSFEGIIDRVRQLVTERDNLLKALDEEDDFLNLQQQRIENITNALEKEKSLRQQILEIQQAQSEELKKQALQLTITQSQLSTRFESVESFKLADSLEGTAQQIKIRFEEQARTIQSLLTENRDALTVDQIQSLEERLGTIVNAGNAQLASILNQDRIENAQEIANRINNELASIKDNLTERQTSISRILEGAATLFEKFNQERFGSFGQEKLALQRGIATDIRQGDITKETIASLANSVLGQNLDAVIEANKGETQEAIIGSVADQIVDVLQAQLDQALANLSAGTGGSSQDLNNLTAILNDLRQLVTTQEANNIYDSIQALVTEIRSQKQIFNVPSSSGLGGILTPEVRLNDGTETVVTDIQARIETLNERLLNLNSALESELNMTLPDIENINQRLQNIDEDFRVLNDLIEGRTESSATNTDNTYNIEVNLNGSGNNERDAYELTKLIRRELQRGTVGRFND